MSYDNALKVLKLQSLKERREDLCLKFAQKCLQVPKFESMFPRNQRDHNMEKRRPECFQVRRGLTERLRKSAIPHMQRLLNCQMEKKRNICRKIDTYKPVNYGSFCNLYHWEIKNFHYYYVSVCHITCNHQCSDTDVNAFSWGVEGTNKTFIKWVNGPF